MGRSIVAVVAGYLIFGISAAVLFGATGVDPHAPASMAFMIGSTIYGMVFAGLGGFVATRIAPSNPHIHAFIVGALIDAGAIISIVAQPGAGEIWSQVAAIAFMSTTAILVGALVMIRNRNQVRG
jgi:hypothetical protein